MGSIYDFVAVTNSPKRHAVFSPKNDSSSDVWSKWYEGMKNKIAGDGGLFAFIGKRGVGKTQLGVSLLGANHYVLKKKSYYIKALDMFDALRESDEKFKAMLTRVDVLVIDAVEVRKESDFEVRELNRIIDKRYDRKGSTTILISNDTKEAFEEFVGDSVISRLGECGGVLEFSGIDSFRGK